MIDYRSDIDGLRALAVSVVILFHLGFLPNGYLGVDVFFVISGYLVTSIIYNNIQRNTFSLWPFFERRIRRILPLLFLITTIALLVGVYLMLPDDLENLAQSVVASNFSANNILMLLTSSNYWATHNEYKPLMHTWSLGIEEQFYIVYPILIAIAAKIKKQLVPILLFVLTAISLVYFLFNTDDAARFYLLPSRFFELSIGGFFAIILSNVQPNVKIIQPITWLAIVLLLVVFFVNGVSFPIVVIATVLATLGILIGGKYLATSNIGYRLLFQNKLVVFIGKISFSLYLWHQVVFAYARYAYVEQINGLTAIVLMFITVLLSVVTYYAIEQPFRNKQKIATPKVLLLLSSIMVLSSTSALYLYMIGGVYKDFPVIGVTRKDVADRGYNFFSGSDNIHIHYNESVRSRADTFNATTTKKVLVIGNSFGRDVVNLLLESGNQKDIDVVYIDINAIEHSPLAANNWKQADKIIVAAQKFISRNQVAEMATTLGITPDFAKIVCFGPKDFGYSNGIPYNRLDDLADVKQYYATPKAGIIQVEEAMKAEWNERYISLLAPVSNEQHKVRIFTDDGLFISQDTAHFTKAGAQFYARLMKSTLEQLLR